MATFTNKCKNNWSLFASDKLKLLTKLRSIPGTEVRDLPPNHFLGKNGEQGLYATKTFKKFDIIGEYCGEIVPVEIEGHYCAALEDTEDITDSLGCNAETCGNETRFINSYLNIDFFPNAKMKRCYISAVPHIFIVCIKDIEENEEILLDYGESYNNMYLS